MRDINEVFKSIANGYDDDQIKKDVKNILFAEQRTKYARQNAYNYDYSSISFKGLESKDVLDKYIFQNKIKEKLVKVVRNASDYGLSGMLLRFAKDNIITQNVYIQGNPTYSNEVLTEAYMSIDVIDLNSYDEQNTELMRLWLNEEGKYVLTYVDVPLNENGDAFDFINGKVQKIDLNGMIIPREYVYNDFTDSPLEILENNEEAKGDWEYASETLRLFTKFDSIIEVEWEYLKVQMINNLLTGSDMTAEEIKRKIESGDRIFDLADMDGLGGTPLSILSAGGITAEIARTIKENYKTEVDEIMFALGKLSGGNNKHTTEALISNVAAFNYLFVKKEFFKGFLSRLFTKISSSLNVIGSTKEQVDFVDADIKFSYAIEMILQPEQKQVPSTNPKPVVSE